jgi:HEAT repeat protein
MRKSDLSNAQERIISRLSGANRLEAFEAAKQVCNGDSNALAKHLIEILRSGRRAFNRSAAAYAMQGVRTPLVIAPLERTVRNPEEASDVRGHAAETLARYHRRATHRLIQRQLQDTSKDVRFWCAFALGQMQEAAAIPSLRLLLKDKRVIRGFHSIAKEAADAIALVEQRTPRSRCTYCIRDSDK